MSPMCCRSPTASSSARISRSTAIPGTLSTAIASGASWTRSRICADTSHMTYVIGLDIGTTSTIGILIGLPDRILHIASRPVTLTSRHPGWAEEDPEQWWTNACAIMRELTAAGGIAASDVAAVGVTGMLPAVVLLDDEGRLLRPSIQQSDARCAAEVAELRREVDEAAFTAKTGNGINQQLVIAKLRWIRKHEPEVFARIATVFGSYDYINWRLTGERAIE